MKYHRFFIYGFLLSILLHLSFLLVFIKINIPLKTKKQPIYISLLKPTKKLIENSSIEKPKKPNIVKSITKQNKLTPPRKYKESKSPSTKIDYNLSIPSLKQINIKSINAYKGSSRNSKDLSKAKKPNLNIKHEHQAKTPTGKTISKSEKPKGKTTQETIKQKHITTLGSYFDLISYLEVVFRYIHEHCRGEGVLMFDLYKDGSLRLVRVEKGDPSCDKNLQAPPMPSSVMENSLQFLINIP